MATLDVRHLSVSYLTDEGVALNAAEDISFQVDQGKSLGIVGESGCGKTTVMLALLRLLPEAGRIMEGQVLLDGEDLLQCSEAEMRNLRWSKISIVFQGAMNALNPVRTIESQIVEVLRIHGVEGQSQQARVRAGELLELVGIPPERGRQYPHQYSGGMRQRAMIAMALACNPRVLIADEPTTALDVMIQAQILNLLRKLQKSLNLALIIVTHDLGVVAEICDDVLVMYSGTVVETGSSDAIFNHPRHPYTERLLQAFPDIESPDADLVSIPGNPPRLDELPPGCRFAPRCHIAEERCHIEVPKPIEIEHRHWCACHLYTGRRE
ncbi:MAG TPA: ABC transporter ATP-binding protein [Chloroflexi bacterium]|nr:ABC transporter ATP-binding protein [Chloroflexota bacterium]